MQQRCQVGVGMEAYIMQNLTQTLIDEFLRQTKTVDKKVGRK
jgi:hypothetical protein